MKRYVCPVCGYTYEGEEPPAKCPQCGVPGEKFLVKEITNEKKVWACEHVIGVGKDVDPEVKQAMLEVGEKVLGMGEWLKDFNARTTDMIAHCDEIIAKCEATDRKPRGRQGKGRRK